MTNQPKHSQKLAELTQSDKVIGNSNSAIQLDEEVDGRLVTDHDEKTPSCSDHKLGSRILQQHNLLELKNENISTAMALNQLPETVKQKTSMQEAGPPEHGFHSCRSSARVLSVHSNIVSSSYRQTNNNKQMQTDYQSSYSKSEDMTQGINMVQIKSQASGKDFPVWKTKYTRQQHITTDDVFKGAKEQIKLNNKYKEFSTLVASPDLPATQPFALPAKPSRPLWLINKKPNSNVKNQSQIKNILHLRGVAARDMKSSLNTISDRIENSNENSKLDNTNTSFLVQNTKHELGSVDDEERPPVKRPKLRVQMSPRFVLQTKGQYKDTIVHQNRGKLQPELQDQYVIVKQMKNKYKGL